MVKKLLIGVAVVLALSLGSFFIPAQEMSIEGIGQLSFETKVTLSVGTEAAYAAPDTQQRAPTSDTDFSGIWALTPAGGSRYEKIDEATADDTDFITQTTAAGGYSYHTFAAFSVPAGSVVNNVTVYYRHRRNAESITFVAASAAATANSGNVTVTPPATQTDDIMICAVSTHDNVSLSFPAGWTKIYEGNNLAGLRSTAAWKRCVGAEGAFTITHTGGSGIVAGVAVFRGCVNSGSPVDAYSLRHNAPSSTCTADAITTTVANAMVLFVMHDSDDGTSSGQVATDPATFVERFDYTVNPPGAGNDAAVSLASNPKASTGSTGNATGSLTAGADRNSGGLIALRPDITANIRAAIEVGGTLYSTTDAGTNPTTSFTNGSYAFTINPQTGVAWTIADVNGAGGNALQAFGVNSADSSPNISVSQCYAIVDYTPSAPPTCWLSGWAKRVRLSIDHNDIAAPLTDFPVLVYLSTSSGRNNDDVSFIFDELQDYANRLKIAVTLSDCTTQCYVEIEKWDQTNEQAWLWVRVPSISDTTDTELHLYYDQNQADNTTYVGDTNSAPAEMVWDGNFKLVQHLGENSTVVHDSTVNNNDETNPPPAPPSPGYIRATYNDPGSINGCYSFSNGSRIQMAHSSSLDITESITLEALVYLNDKTNGKLIIKDDPFDIGGAGCYNLQQELRGADYALELQLDLGGWVRASYATYNTGEWLYVVGTYDRQTMRLYLNGVEQATNPQTAAIRSGSTVNVALGNRADDNGTLYDLNGLLDEARVSNTTRSPAWIAASYESGRDDLIDFGAEETRVVDIVNVPPSKDFGPVLENSPYWSNGSEPTFPLDDGECFFTLTNNSSDAVNITIMATDFTGGVGWTLAGTPGANIVTLKAGRSGDNLESDMVTLTTSDQSFILSMGESSSRRWELKLDTGTFTDYVQKTSTITLTATYS
jgi:hypothetical protein